MRSKLHKKIMKLLDDEGCTNYCIFITDPDSSDVWRIWDGNRQWIYGELQRFQEFIKGLWRKDEEKDGDEKEYGDGS